jgi:hypothetical protein
MTHRRFPTQAEVRMAVFDFIEGWSTRTGAIPAWPTSCRSAMNNGTQTPKRRSWSNWGGRTGRPGDRDTLSV